MRWGTLSYFFILILNFSVPCFAYERLADVDNARRIHEIHPEAVRQIYLVVADPVSKGMVSRFGHAVLRVSTHEDLNPTDEIIDFYTANRGQDGLVENIRGLLPVPPYRIAALTPGLVTFRNRLKAEARGFTNYQIDFPPGGRDRVVTLINSFIRTDDLTPEYYNWFFNNCASMSARVLDYGLGLQLFGTTVQSPRALPKKLIDEHVITRPPIHENSAAAT